jgi:hypothetical protein
MGYVFLYDKADDRLKPWLLNFKFWLLFQLKKVIPDLSRLIYRPISSIMDYFLPLGNMGLLDHSSTSLSLLLALG